MDDQLFTTDDSGDEKVENIAEKMDLEGIH